MTNYFRGALLSMFGTALADTLIWEDQFDTLDFSKWQHEITMGGGGNWEFEGTPTTAPTPSSRTASFTCSQPSQPIT